MKTVLITGGSSGIGYEISTYFAADGYHILWVSLMEDELAQAKTTLLTQVPEVKIDSMAIDLSDEGSSTEVLNWVQKNNWSVDVLVNNAGFGTFGFASDIPIEKEQQMIRLNVLNLFTLSRLFLDEMIARDSGTIINISSNTSFQPVPKMSAYAATKAFVKHYSLSIHEELKDLGSAVRMITICPAAISNTPFKKVAKMDKVKTFEGLVATTKEEVAKDVWTAFEQGKHYMPSGAKLRRTIWLNNLLPHSLVQFMLRRELKEE